MEERGTYWTCSYFATMRYFLFTIDSIGHQGLRGVSWELSQCAVDGDVVRWHRGRDWTSEQLVQGKAIADKFPVSHPNFCEIQGGREAQITNTRKKTQNISRNFDLFARKSGPKTLCFSKACSNTGTNCMRKKT